MKWYKLAAQQGNVKAHYNLGVSYDLEGVPQDYKAAVKWYRLAAKQGYPQAQYNLGVMYVQGHGVPKDVAMPICGHILLQEMVSSRVRKLGI